jgi:anti-sigma B factor antagonist
VRSTQTDALLPLAHHSYRPTSPGPLLAICIPKKASVNLNCDLQTSGQPDPASAAFSQQIGEFKACHQLAHQLLIGNRWRGQDRAEAGDDRGSAQEVECMDLVTEQFAGVDVIRLPRRVVMADAPSIRRDIRRMVEKGRKNIVLDLSAVAFIDSSGLSVLVSAREAARAGGGDVLLLNPTATVRSLIELTRLQEVFEIFGSEERAVQRLASANDALTAA